MCGVYTRQARRPLHSPLSITPLSAIYHPIIGYLSPQARKVEKKAKEAEKRRQRSAEKAAEEAEAAALASHLEAAAKGQAATGQAAMGQAASGQPKAKSKAKAETEAEEEKVEVSERTEDAAKVEPEAKAQALAEGGGRSEEGAAANSRPMPAYHQGTTRLHSEAETTAGQQHTTKHDFEPEGSSEPPRGGAVLSPHRQLHKSPREFVDSPRPRKPSNL